METATMYRVCHIPTRHASLCPLSAATTIAFGVRLTCLGPALDLSSTVEGLDVYNVLVGLYLVSQNIAQVLGSHEWSSRRYFISIGTRRRAYVTYMSVQNTHATTERNERWIPNCRMKKETANSTPTMVSLH